LNFVNDHGSIMVTLALQHLPEVARVSRQRAESSVVKEVKHLGVGPKSPQQCRFARLARTEQKAAEVWLFTERTGFRIEKEKKRIGGAPLREGPGRLLRASALTSHGWPWGSAYVRATASGANACPVSSGCCRSNAKVSSLVKLRSVSDSALMLNGLAV